MPSKSQKSEIFKQSVVYCLGKKLRLVMHKSCVVGVGDKPKLKQYRRHTCLSKHLKSAAGNNTAVAQSCQTVEPLKNIRAKRSRRRGL